MENDNNADLIEEEENVKPSKPRWWNPFWLLLAISMIGSGIISFFLIPTSFIRILFWEIFFLIILGIAYYIRIRPSKKVNKAIYILLGITPIGFSFVILYAFTGIGRFLNTLGSWGSWLNLIFILILFIVGGFIGNLIGKKRDYSLPLSLNSYKCCQK